MAHVPLTGWKDVKINLNMAKDSDLDGFVCFQELTDYDLASFETVKKQTGKGMAKKKKGKKADPVDKKTSIVSTPADTEVVSAASADDSSKLSRKALRKLKWKETMKEKRKEKKQRKISKVSIDSEAENNKSASKNASNMPKKKKSKQKKNHDIQQSCGSQSVSCSETISSKPDSDSNNVNTINPLTADDSPVQKLDASCKSVSSNKNSKKIKKTKHKQEAVKHGRIVDSQAVVDISMVETEGGSVQQDNKATGDSKGNIGASRKSKEKATKRKAQDKKQSLPAKKAKTDTESKPEEGSSASVSDLSAWKDMFVPEPVLRALAEQGFNNPTPIQALSLPPAIRDRMDIIGAAETGSGKTLAFGIPLIHHILQAKANIASQTRDAGAVDSDMSDDNLSDLDEESESEVEGQMEDLDTVDHGEIGQALDSEARTGDVEPELIEVDPTKVGAESVCIVDMADSASSSKGHSPKGKKPSKAIKCESNSDNDGAESVDDADNDDGDDDDNDDDDNDDDGSVSEDVDSDEGSVQDLSTDLIAMATEGIEDEFSDGEYDLPPEEEELEELAEGDTGCVAVVNDVEFDWLQDKKVQKTKQPKQSGKDKPLYALILTPTRELAIQVKNHLEAAAKYTDIKVCVVVGGMASQKQERVLKKQPEIVVATPGRLWELHQQGEPHLNKMEELHHLVIDEADRMVEKGHFQELSQLLELINVNDKKRRQRQNFVFSATLTLVHSGPQRLILKKKKFKMDQKQKVDSLVGQVGLHEKAKVIDLSQKQGTAETLTEARINCSQEEKDLYLYYFMRQYPGRTLVFVNSKDCLRRLVTVFGLLQCNPLPLHSDMHQRQRLKNLDKFKEKSPSMLIATDVAARGLDIPNVEHVIHFQVPRTTENYVHRSGRTARASKEGLSVMLIGPDDLKSYRRIIHTLNRDEDLPMFPTEGEALTALKPRVTLARQIDKEEHVVVKKKKQNSWFVKAAEDMDIELDEDQLLYDLGDQYSQTMEKNKMQSMKEELKYLIKGPIMQRSGSGKYPTKTGKLVIPYMSGGDKAKGAVNAMKLEKQLIPKSSHMSSTVKVGKQSKKKFKKRKK